MHFRSGLQQIKLAQVFATDTQTITDDTVLEKYGGGGRDSGGFGGD